MADKEKVLYEFQGDVSSLRTAAQQALGMVDKIQTQMNKFTADGMVKASQRAQAGFQSSLNKVKKDIDGLQKKMSSVGDVKMARGSEAFNTTKTSVDTLVSTLNKLGSSNTITTKSLNEMKTGLNSVTTGLRTSGPAFDTIIAKEQKFQNLLTAVDAKASQFGSKVSGATQRVQSAFSTMSTFVSSKLNTMGAMFTPLVTKIQGMHDKASIAGNRIAQVFSTAASAFRRTAVGTDDASSSQNRLSRIVDSVKEKFSKLKKEVGDTGKEYKGLEGSSEKAGTAMSAGASVALKAFDSLKNVVTGLVDSFFALAGVDLGNLLADGAKSAIDYVENLNLFQVAMGSSVDKGTAFINKMQEVYGMDPSNLMRYAGYFYQLTDAIGMADGASASISLSLTKMANDLASLFNKDIESTVNALSSGMMGMTRTVRQFGMDIRNTTLQVTALKYGLTEQVENMSEANRQALRFITMHDQAQNAINQFAKGVDGGSTAMGDFARNIETPANQLRIFKEQMSQLGRAVGNFIVAPLAKALPYINGFIMALRTLVNFVASLFGVAVKAGSSLSDVSDSAEKAATGVGGIGDSAGKAAKKLKQLIAPFDELNVLQEQSDDSGGGGGGGFGGDVLDPALAEAIANMELNLENIQMKANRVRDSILEFLGLKVTTDPITGEQIIQWDSAAFQANVMESLNSFKNWFLELDPIWQGIAAITAVNLAFMALTTPILSTILILSTLLAFSEEFRESFVGLWNSIVEGLKPIGKSLGSLFGTIGSDMVTMWSTHIEPTIAAIGDALAPALDTLGSLWGNVSVIIADCFGLIESFWTTVARPVIEGALTILGDLADMFKSLWEKFIGPVLEYIGDGLQRLWTDTFSPIINNVIGLIGDLWALIMDLWNNVFSPLITWLIDTFGPIFESIFKGIWNVIEPIIGNIGQAINGLVDVLRGIIKFITSVFKGDWEGAWEGIVQAFEGIWNTIEGICKIPLNLVIGLINGLLKGIEKGINWVVDKVNTLSFDVPDWVPGIGGETFGFDLSRVSLGKIEYLASGGVVTGPTPAMIGEGKYSEAVIPLDDSPQMQDLIDKIAEAVDKDKPDNNGGPTEVHVYIGGKEYDAFTYKSSERGKTVVGKQPIKIGG